MSEDRPIKACLCHPHTFARLKVLAEQEGWTTLAEISGAVGCGTGCGLCGPYITRMLATGETEFAVENSPLPSTHRP